MRLHVRSLALLLGSFLAVLCSAQGQFEALPQVGLSAYTPYQHSDVDSVDLSSGNVNLHIPLISFPQLGNKLRMNFIIRYNEPQWNFQVYDINTYPNIPVQYYGQWYLGDGSGADGRPLGVDVVRDQGITETYTTSTHVCLKEVSVPGNVDSGRPVSCFSESDDGDGYGGAGATTGPTSTYSMQYNVRDRTGAEHPMGTYLSQSFLYSPSGSYFTGLSPDGSGWYTTTTSASNGVASWGNVTDRDGVHYTYAPVTLSCAGTCIGNAYTVSDDHGNQITTTANGWTDSMGRNIPGGWEGYVGASASTSGVTAGFGAAWPENDPIPGVPASVPSSCPSATAAREWQVPYQDGSTATYWFCYSDFNNVTSNFQLTSMMGYYGGFPTDGLEATVSARLLTSVVLPDGTAYKFHYDSQFLDLTEIDFPTGGYVTYGYTTVPWDGCNTSAPAKRVVSTRSVYDGTATHTWQYYWSAGGTCTAGAFYGVALNVIVLKPDGNAEFHQTDPSVPSTVTIYYNGGAGTNALAPSGNAVKSVYERHAMLTSPFFATQTPIPDGNTTWPGYIVGKYTYQEQFMGPVVETLTTLDDGSVSGTAATMVPNTSSVVYEDPGLAFSYAPGSTIADRGGYCACINYTEIAETKEYDFGSPGSGNPGTNYNGGTPGSLLNRMDTTYMFNDGGSYNSSYTAANLIDLPSSTTVYNGSGTQVAAATYQYDQTTTVGAISGPLSAGATAGDLTTVSKWKTGSTWVTTNTAYNSTGEVLAKIDAKGTVSAYVGSFECSGLLPHQVYLAYGTSIQEGETYTHDCTSGHIKTYTDPNGQESTFTYSDSGYLNRLTAASYPDGGSVGIAYTDGSSSSVQLTTAVNSSTTQTQTAYYDALGRTATVDSSSPEGNIIQKTTYDSLGRKYTVSNPYLTTSDPTYGLTTYTYDELSRPTQVQNPDGTLKAYSYSGATTTATDEVGSVKSTTVDGLGRLIKVNEAAPCDSSSSGNITTYTYDPLGNLTGVSQPGVCESETPYPRSRSFIYDGLSELTSATNPETGTITYPTYDANGNLKEKDSPDPNASSGTVALGYCYDLMNRVIAKFYSSPPGDCATGAVATYSYGTSTTGNTVGRLISAQAIDSNGTTYWKASGQTYDPMGRLWSENQYTPGSGSSYYTLNYTYDYMGHVASNTNGLSGTDAATLTYTYDDSARLSTLTSSWSDSAHPTKLFDASATSPAAYGAMGLLQANLAVNNTTLVPAITMARTYDKRGRILTEADMGPSTSSGSTSTGALLVVGGASLGAATASGDISISGSEQYDDMGDPDSGWIYVYVGYTNASVSYDQTSSVSSLTSALVSQLNANSGGAYTATAQYGYDIHIVANSPGTAGNLSLAVASYSGDPQINSASYYGYTSGSMTGGAASDTGTISVTINGHTSSPVSWNSSSTTSGLASSLASAIQSASSGTLLATASGPAVVLQSTAGGSSTDWSISPTVTDTAGNSSAGFGVVPDTMNSGGSLYRYANTYDGVGDVLTVSDSVMGLMSFTGGYDALHRLTGGSFFSGPYAGDYGCWSYDSFGNRTAEAVSTTPCSSSPSPNTWAAYASGTNRITSGSNTFTYSAAGNVTYDGLNTYLYDGENRICAVENAATSVFQYLYDTDGNRIAKASASLLSCSPIYRTGWVTQYLLGPGGEDVTELSGSNAWNYSNIYAGGSLLGTYSGSNTDFSMNDWLGTKRAEATASGSNCATYSSLPFGNGLSENGSCDPSEQHFTGKLHDFETSNDYFGARYYANTMGRWMSPDLVNVTEDRMISPSSTLNKYSYAANNPLKYIDPDGQDIVIYLENGVPGHIMMMAYDPSSSSAAVRSFGPDVDFAAGFAGSLNTLAGLPVPATTRFDFEKLTSANAIRKNFASITIKTSPEVTQQVVQAIVAHSGDKWYTTFGYACASSCARILRQLTQLRGVPSEGPLVPNAFFNDLYSEYGNGKASLSLSGSAVFKPGNNYGAYRPAWDPFDVLFSMINPEKKKPHRNCTLNVTPNGTSGNC